MAAEVDEMRAGDDWRAEVTQQSHVTRAETSADAPRLTGDRHILETDFELPFMEWDAFAPAYGDDVVMEFAFTNPDMVKSLVASINGKQVEVRRYQYATKPEWYSYYIEITGHAAAGINKLALEIEWQQKKYSYFAEKDLTAIPSDFFVSSAEIPSYFSQPGNFTVASSILCSKIIHREMGYFYLLRT